MLTGWEEEHMVAMARSPLRRSEEGERRRSHHRNGDRRRLRVVTLRITRYT